MCGLVSCAQGPFSSERVYAFFSRLGDLSQPEFAESHNDLKPIFSFDLFLPEELAEVLSRCPNRGIRYIEVILHDLFKLGNAGNLRSQAEAETLTQSLSILKQKTADLSLDETRQRRLVDLEHAVDQAVKQWKATHR
jgi:hypothetical protein